jgi:hypothetical protein
MQSGTTHGTVGVIKEQYTATGDGGTNYLYQTNRHVEHQQSTPPLMDCGQGKSKNCVRSDPAIGGFSVEGGGKDVCVKFSSGERSRFQY